MICRQAGKSFFFVIFGLFAQFSHGKMQSQHKAWLHLPHDWKFSEPLPAIRDHYQADQNHHVSHLFIYGMCDFCTCFIASLQALHHLRLFGEPFFLWLLLPCNLKKAAEWISNQFQVCISDVWTSRARKNDITAGKASIYHAPCGLDHITETEISARR